MVVKLRNLEQIITGLNELVEQYQNTPESDGETLLSLAQQIAGTLYFLSEEKTKEQKNFEKYVYVLTREQGYNVNRAMNAAEVAYPNLYRLRYIIRAGYAVLDVIRSQVSYLKQEMIHSKH